MSEETAGGEPDTATYLRHLKETDALRERMNLEIIRWLDLPKGSAGLDVGCGCGTQALMLSEAVGPEGHVTGLDVKPEFLAVAREAASKRNLSDRLSLVKGDFNRLTFDAHTFDWLWSSDCIGYQPPTEEIIRVIKPGGRVNLSFWSSEQLLPGYPVLEARLKATAGGIAPFAEGNDPKTHPLRTLSTLKRLGVTGLKAATFVTTVHAPLSDRIRRGMIDILEMRWPGVENELSREDLDLYRQITDPGSPRFILDLPDYYGFFTYSTFTGVVAG